MDPSTIRMALEEAEVFGNLPGDALDELSHCFKGAEVAKGEYIFFEGDESDRIYLCPQGRIKVVRHSPEGREVLIEVVPAGRPFALLAGIEGSPLSASAVAMEDCSLLSVDRERFLRLLQQHPELSMSVIHDLASRLRDARDRIRSLALERVEQRIARILLTLAESLGRRAAGRVVLDLSLTRQDIASMVGTTVESAIRTMSRFQKEGLLRTAHGGRIEILDNEALRRVAEASGMSASTPGRPKERGLKSKG
ncbi:MAG: Crp/Fnr family transcriptional regulator [Candidatus Sumerlaeota bacterium]|nr:Crp/Fnr family transcriptional regulator [Candidatus Sumerlaeota bacterium]